MANEHDDAHPEFIAHHFDDGAEQQYDSGKLGIWAFLVTEILFFSGLFVAYTLVRSHQPEIFDQAHVFLDKWLGGLNTVVLLFSSLTMAWAVRCAQLGKNKAVTGFVLITMVCAAMFLGVKAIEYSHKWDQGILVRSAFNYSTSHHEPATAVGKALGVSDYLVYLSIIPAILLVAFVALAGFFKMNKEKAHVATFMGCMAITVGGYFLGVLLAQGYMMATDGGVGGHSHAKAAPVVLMAETLQEESHDGEEHAKEDHDGHDHDKEGHHAEGDGDGHEHDGDHEHAEGHDHGDEHHSDASHGPDPTKFHRDIGVFFSIYYCMTGLHAIHIIAGIIALAWILWRSILGQWRSDYFGPVDYVGLYWHLVDLIWIYLFPMLYLID